jgi:hypothetical protein
MFREPPDEGQTEMGAGLGWLATWRTGKSRHHHKNPVDPKADPLASTPLLSCLSTSKSAHEDKRRLKVETKMGVQW